MSDTYSYEVLEPGGHTRLVGNVLDRISRASTNPASAVGSSRAVLGDAETASWTERTTAADGAALIESVQGNTLRWNQGVKNDAYWNDNANTTHTIADGLITVTSTSTTTFGVYKSPSTIGDGNGLVVGHTYCGLADVNPSINASMYFGLNVSSSGTDAIVFGRAVASGVWTRIGGIVKLTATSNNGLRIAVCGNTTISAGDTFQAKNVQLFDLTAMFGAGNEPATVAEFEALYPLPYYSYDPGSLLPVRMTGVETVGFNQWDEQWEVGAISQLNGGLVGYSDRIRSKNYIPVIGGQTYYIKGSYGVMACYDGNKDYIGNVPYRNATVLGQYYLDMPANACYVRFSMGSPYGTAYKYNICINISDPSRNGTYEPYWSSQRAIPAATYFPDGLRSAGSVYDELRADAAVTRVGAVDLGTLDWNYNANWGGYPAFWSPSLRALAAPNAFASGMPSVECAAIEVVSRDTLYDSSSNGITLYGTLQPDLSARYSGASDAAAFKTAMSGVMLYYALATPTTTPIDPPLPMSYRVGAGGTERVMVASGTTSAPPIFATRYPLDPADLAASIAPVDGPIAKTNHQVGDLIMLGFTLCKATQVIVTGETIAIGTNVTRTSVAAEIAALS